MAILQQVQNPPRCQRVEDLGAVLEDWLSKKRQYEMFTDRNGRPCQASDDSLVAAMFRLLPKSLEETVMFANEDEDFQELYDRLLAYSSTKQSIQMSESKKTTRKDDPMDVDALSKGSRERKIERQRQRQRQVEQCRKQQLAKKVGQKQVTNMLMDGLGVVNKLMGGGRRQIGRQEVVQDGGRKQTIGHLLGKRRTSRRDSRSTALKIAGARTPEGMENREREGGEDHERKDKQ